jgi:hypothetical protein
LMTVLEDVSGHSFEPDAAGLGRHRGATLNLHPDLEAGGGHASP